MKYRVRNEVGEELQFSSFREVERAWLLGLVEPTDLVFEGEGKVGRRAGALPLLRAARTTGESAWRGAWFLWVVIGVAGATIALRLLASPSPVAIIAGLVITFAISGLMVRVTITAHRRSRRI